MKKRMILASLALAAIAAPAFAVAFHDHGHERGVNNFSCNYCKGTGHAFGDLQKGPCAFCRGTGFNGSY